MFHIAECAGAAALESVCVCVFYFCASVCVFVYQTHKMRACRNDCVAHTQKRRCGMRQVRAQYREYDTHTHTRRNAQMRQQRRTNIYVYTLVYLVAQMCHVRVTLDC